MQVHTNPASLAASHPHIVFAVGFFDGVHLGHRAILGKCGIGVFSGCIRPENRLCENDMQNTGGLPHEYIPQTRLCHISAVLTFDPHPLAILAPARKPPLLTPLSNRLRLIAETGIDTCLLLPFTHELATLSPEEFITQTLGEWLKPSRSVTLVAGENWRFGRGGVGDLATVASVTKGAVKTICVPSVTLDGEAVSSSAIRRFIAAGDFVRASAMLGRRYEIRGTAIPGRGIGSTIGFATANIIPEAELLPPCGVYAVEAQLAGTASWYHAIANFGHRPTFDGENLLLEVHILNGFANNLHGVVITTRFIAKIRDERKFASADELVEQIKTDIQNSKVYFNN